MVVCYTQSNASLIMEYRQQRLHIHLIMVKTMQQYSKRFLNIIATTHLCFFIAITIQTAKVTYQMVGFATPTDILL